MSFRIFRFFLVLCCFLSSLRVLAVDPFADWKTLESPHFYIHFDQAHQPLAQRVARIAESVHQRLSPLLKWQPVEKTHLVLSDESDAANGYAITMNINRSVLFLATPRGANGLEDFDDWMELLITHEYVHVLHLDKVTGDPAVFRELFGRFLLSFPNNFQPGWLIEGLATYYETDTRHGVGRGQSTLFASLMRMEVERGIAPVDKVNLPFTTWPAGVSRYLYGVYFFLFVEDVYGKDKVQALVDEYSSHLIPFSLNSAFRAVFGKDVRAIWSRFGDWLGQRFDSEIRAIKSQGIVTGERITDSGYRTGPLRVRGDALYYVENNGAQQPVLIKLQHGEKTVLSEVTGAGFDVRDNGDVLISQFEVCDEYRLYKDLYLYHAASGKMRRLTECGRYVQAVWKHRQHSIVALRHDAGVYALVELDQQGRQLRTLTSFDARTIAGWFDVSPDDRQLVVSLWKPGKGWNLYLYDLERKRWQSLTDDSTVQAWPQFTPDGNSILYSAETRHAYNLFRYDIQSAQHQQISNALGGAFQADSNADAIYYVGLSPSGTDIYRLPADTLSHNQAKPVSLGRLQIRYHKPVSTQLTDYDPLPALRPRWWFPVVSLNEDRMLLGMTTSGNDALGIHNYFLSADLDVSNTQPEWQAAYSFSNRFSVALRRDHTLFRNPGGSLNRLRRDDSLQLVLAWPDTKALSSSSLLLALSWQHNTDSRLFNNAAPAATIDDNLLGFAWRYNSSRLYPLSISPNDGRRIQLVVEDGAALSADFDGQVLTASWREYLRLGGEHVLALRAMLGRGNGDTSDFRLGGESNGVQLDLFLNTSGNALFGRRGYALRGYAEGLPQLRGQNAQLLSAEWRFPGQRIERGIMVPPVGIMQWHGALFAETGAAFDGSVPQRYYSSAGVEISADLNLFYLVPIRARLGVAHGFDDALGDTRVYLSLGSSF